MTSKKCWGMRSETTAAKQQQQQHATVSGDVTVTLPNALTSATNLATGLMNQQLLQLASMGNLQVREHAYASTYLQHVGACLRVFVLH